MSQASSFEMERWIKYIGQGDRDALAQLYRATSSSVYAYALSIVKNRQDAEDALHDTFVSIWHSAGDYRPQGKPLAWIMTVTRNHCLMRLRQQRRFVSLDRDTPLPDGGDPADAMMLKLCMEQLTDEERQIVVLHAIAGMKHRQIGQLLGLNTSTVLSKYHRSLHKLREHF